MIIKGVGTFLAKRFSPDGKGVEVLTLGTMQDLRFDFNVDVEDIFGGDGLFPIDDLVTGKGVDITATDAKFDLDAVSLMMGSKVQEQVDDYVWVLGEEQTLDGSASATVNFASTIYQDGNFTVRLKDTNKLLSRVTSAPSEDEFTVSGGEITLNAVHANKDIVVSYQRQAVVDKTDLLAEEVPFPVHIIHHGSFLQKDGTYQGIETELYSCRARGSFTINAQRATANASTVTLRLLDPERADGKLGVIKRYAATSQV